MVQSNIVAAVRTQCWEALFDLVFGSSTSGWGQWVFGFNIMAKSWIVVVPGSSFKALMSHSVGDRLAFPSACLLGGRGFVFP